MTDTNDQPLSEDDQKKALEFLDRKLTFWIKVVGWVLVSFFGWLEIRDAQFQEITDVVQDTAILKLGLIIFFLAWAYGATDDTRIQTKAYGYDPHGGRVGLNEAIGIAVFLAIFGGLYFFHDQPVVFQAFLLAFICTNMWTYSVVVMGRARAIIEKSASLYAKQGDYQRYMKLYCAVEYLLGGWQKRRFLTLLALALCQLAVSAALTFYGVPKPVANLEIRDVTGQDLAVYMPSVLFVLYVLISEAWIKIYRFKVFSDFETIEETHEHFRVQRKPNGDLPPIDLDNLFRRKMSPHPNYV